MKRWIAISLRISNRALLCFYIYDMNDTLGHMRTEHPSEGSRCDTDGDGEFHPEPFTKSQAAFFILAMTGTFLIWTGSIIMSSPDSVVTQFGSVLEGLGFNEVNKEYYVRLICGGMVATGLLGLYGASLALLRRSWRRTFTITLVMTLTTPIFLFSGLASMAALMLWRGRGEFD